MLAGKQKRMAIERGKLAVNQRRGLRNSKYGTRGSLLKEVSGRNMVLEYSVAPSLL